MPPGGVHGKKYREKKSETNPGVCSAQIFRFYHSRSLEFIKIGTRLALPQLCEPGTVRSAASFLLKRIQKLRKCNDVLSVSLSLSNEAGLPLPSPPCISPELWGPL